MNLQYILDSSGNTTGIYIPIEDWDKFKKKYKGIELEDTDIPDWQKNVVRDRLEEYKNHPDVSMDFDSAIDDIEKEL